MVKPGFPDADLHTLWATPIHQASSIMVLQVQIMDSPV